MRNEEIRESMIKDKVCIFQLDCGVFNEEIVKRQVIDLINKIPLEDFGKIEIYRPYTTVVKKGGIKRNFFIQFIYDNLFKVKTIYIEDMVYATMDEVEQKIFIALMSLFGIEVYDTFEEEVVEPDPVYCGEIVKAFHENIDMPECILEASDDELEEIKYMAAAILLEMWDECRNKKMIRN